MTDHEELDVLAADLAWGTLDGRSLAEARERLDRAGAEGDAALRRAQRLADELVLATEPVEVAPSVRESLLARARRDVATSARPTPRRRRVPWTSIAAAASLLAAVGLGVWVNRLSNELDRRASEFEGLRMAVADQAVARPEIVIGRIAPARSSDPGRSLERSPFPGLDRVVTALTGQTTFLVPLRGQPAAPGASGRAFFQPETERLMLFVYQLASPPDTKTYQAWMIEQDKTTSIGTFDIASEVKSQYEFDRIPPYSGPIRVLVTLEDRGGAERPSGPVVLAGR